MSPVMEDTPLLLNAPTAVNKAKFEVEPRLGAWLYPVSGIKSKTMTFNTLCSSVFNFMIYYSVSKYLQRWVLCRKKSYTIPARNYMILPFPELTHQLGNKKFIVWNEYKQGEI